MSTEGPNSDVQRFTKLWMKNQDALAGYIYLSIRDFHHAEDVLQEVAQSAAGSFDRYDASRPFIAWLIAIARQRIADYYRRQGRRLPTLSGSAMEELAEAQMEMVEEMDSRLGHCGTASRPLASATATPSSCGMAARSRPSRLPSRPASSPPRSMR